MSKFLDFLGDLKAYIPTPGDVLKTVLFSGNTITPTNQGAANFITDEAVMNQFIYNSPALKKSKTFYETDQGALFYPEDLFQSGNEAYILFYMRDSVYSGAKLMKRMALYMPPSISVSYGANWSPINMFVTTDQRSALKSSAENILNSDSASVALESVKAAFKRGGPAQDAFLTAAAKSLGQVAMTQTNIGQQASVIAQKTINPMTALSFRSVNLRKFKFRFELMARSANESNSINDIINSFKFGMHPDSVKGTTSDAKLNTLSETVLMHYPNTFDVYLFSPSSEYLFQIQRSILTNMAVDYNGNRVASFFKGTGAPTNITLELDFQETELLTKDRVVEGY